MNEPKVGQIWIRRFDSEYVFIKRISPLYVYYDIITGGHLSCSCTIDGFTYNYELYQ